MEDKKKRSIWHKAKTYFLGVKYEVITKDEAGNIISIEEDLEHESIKDLVKYYLLITLTWILTFLIGLTAFFWFISGSPLGIAKFGYTYYITTQWAMDPPAKEE